LAEIVLKPRKSRPFYNRHPWVLDTAIDRVEGSPADGDVVDLLSDKGKFVARGVYNSRSRIRVRLYIWRKTEPLDRDFWRRRLEAALRLRADLGYNDAEGAARLVYSEGDGLSGLIVDRYAEYLAIQVTALAMAVRLDVIVPILVELVHPRGIVIRTERGMTQAEGIELRDGPYWGEPPNGPVFIRDHGLRYGIDLAEGQKTGFYLDQRENRKAAAAYLRGRRVLDMFCYSGGFSIAASALGGAREVLGFDSSAKAVTLARANAELNGLASVRFDAGDAFEVLESMVAAGERFGGVILDPPKFARSRTAVNEALRAYHWLNRLAVQVLEPGGFLVTCSCSGHVAREDFLDMLLGVAQQTGRDIQVLEQRGASPDHPVSATCRESEYLKCFVCRVT
jgi:23S rRNA (cytosine1962-C5)-methyltransferase